VFTGALLRFPGDLATAAARPSVSPVRVPTEIPRTRSGLTPLLAARGLRLQRKLGQNFLVDPQLADALVRDAGVTRRDAVVEIGPGAGALTQPLLDAAGHVTAVEIDRGLHALLDEHLGDHPRLTLVQGDCLVRGDLHPAIREALAPTRRGEFERLLVVANLPYSVGTAVTARLIGMAEPPDALLLMLQHEVVARLRAVPGTRDYGPLPILVGSLCRMELVRRVPPEVFLPRPHVESAVLRIVPDAEGRAAVGDLAALTRLVHAGFRHRRKTLARNLSGIADADLLRSAGLDPKARAETVPPAGWIALARLLHDEGAA